MKWTKNKTFWFVASMVGLYFLLVGIGNVTTEGKTGYTGLGQAPTLMNDATIVFPYFENDQASLYMAKGEQEAELIAKPEEEGHSYIRPAVSPDDESIAFIHSWQGEDTPYKQLMLLEDGNKRALLGKDQFITEASFSPDGKYLYYLKSDLYTNYSSVSQKHPHEMDVYRMNLETKVEEAITSLDAYDMSSLHVWENGKVSYRTFEGKSFEGQDVMKILDVSTGDTKTVKPDSSFTTPSKAPIFSNPTPSPSKNQIAFSEVGSTTDNGTFQYELFLMNRNGENVRQITNFHEHVSRPTFFENGDKLLVTVNRKFARRKPDHEYWVINLKTEEQKEWEIHMPE